MRKKHMEYYIGNGGTYGTTSTCGGQSSPFQSHLNGKTRTFNEEEKLHTSSLCITYHDPVLQLWEPVSLARVA